jgi:hypothetical protein
VVPRAGLADEVRAFVQRPELRALHVAADARLSSGALRVLLAAEHLADNQSPWVPLDVDTHHPDTWVRSEAALVREHEARRRAGAPLAPLAADVAGAPGPGRCAARIRQCAASVGEPARGLVVLFICQGNSVAEPWLQRLGEMLLDPALGSVKLVVLTTLCPTALAWSARFPPSLCVVHRCELDPAAVTADLAAEVEAEENGGGTWPATPTPRPDAAASRAGGAAPTPRAGGAAPGSHAGGAAPGPGTDSLMPPPRAGAPGPREPTAEDELRTCIKRALLALRREDGPETVRQQTRARDLCRDAGRKEDAVRMELVLGGYLMRLHEPERAQESFARAAAAAAEIDARALEAQACYAEAFLWRERRRPEDGLRCYWAGIEAAKRGRHVQLVFDGYWEAGQVLRPLDRPSALVSLWSDAIRTAGGYAPAELRGSRLGDVARELSVELRAMRRTADARAVDEWAAATLAAGGGHAPSAS